MKSLFLSVYVIYLPFPQPSLSSFPFSLPHCLNPSLSYTDRQISSIRIRLKIFSLLPTPNVHSSHRMKVAPSWFLDLGPSSIGLCVCNFGIYLFFVPSGDFLTLLLGEQTSWLLCLLGGLLIFNVWSSETYQSFFPLNFILSDCIAMAFILVTFYPVCLFFLPSVFNFSL